MKSIKFTVDGQLVGELGEKLVSKNHIALAELIKNSYDADATRVRIVIENASSPTYSENGSITIEDNGHGMNLASVKNKWMRIATPNKKENPVSKKYGRPQTGQKGIGRFACQKLANKLVLDTIAKNKEKFQRTSLKIEWNRFKPGVDLTKVKSYYESPDAEKRMPGTILRLDGLKERWEKRDFDVLTRSILILSIARGTKRDGFEQDPGMETEIVDPEWNNEDSGGGLNLYDKFKHAGWGTIIANVNEHGHASVSLDAKDIGKQSYSPQQRFDELRGVSLEVQWLPWKNEHCRDSALLKQYVKREIMKEYGGIRVYFNDFAVYPYGTKNDDWLNINHDQARSMGIPQDEILQIEAKRLGVFNTRPLLYMPRNENLYGWVTVHSSKSTGFSIQMDREGFVENVSFLELKKFARMCIDWATLYYAVYFLRKSEAEKQKNLSELAANSDYPTKPTELIKRLKNDHVEEISQSSPENVKNIGIAYDYLERKIENDDAKLSILQNIASANSVMLALGHESREIIGSLKLSSELIDSIINVVPVTQKKKLKKTSKVLFETQQRMEDQLKLFQLLVARSDDLKEYRLYVLEYVEKIRKVFGFVTEKSGIQIETDISPELRTPMFFKPEWYTIIINLISNAIKVVRRARRAKIRIEAFRTEENTFILRVYDEGIGLSKPNWKRVFEPLNADPDRQLYSQDEKIEYVDDVLLGQGTGLGLSIVKDIVTKRGGTVDFVDAVKPWVTCVEVRLPW